MTNANQSAMHRFADPLIPYPDSTFVLLNIYCSMVATSAWVSTLFEGGDDRAWREFRV
jgi:hypothetical protein